MVRVVLAAGLVLLAGWSFRAVFAEPTLVLLLAMTVPAIIAAAWGCAAKVFGSRMLGAAGTVGAVALVLAAVVLITMPGKDFATGPSRLLTGVLPADADPPQVAAVSALVGLAALVAVRLALRSSLLPLLPALVCLLLGLGLGAAVSPLPQWYVPAFVLLAVIIVQWERRITTLAVIVIAALTGFAATPLTMRAPARLQDVADAQVQPRQHVNPMDQYLALRNGKVDLELAAKGAPVDRLAMITLTSFDQDGWTSGANYRRAGTRFPVDGQHREVTLDLRVLTPDTVGWLPRPGRPTRLDVPGLGFDAATGDITVPAGTATPKAYRITATANPDELSPGDTPVAVGASLPMRLPPEVLGFVERATGGQQAAPDKFAALFQAFTNPLFRYDSSKKAAGGDGIYQISKLLQTYRGTSEQYASAFAVMCRHLGWDARVVLGFQPKWNGDEAQIKGENVFAWTEVRFAHRGWMPFDPSPKHVAPSSDDRTEPDQRPAAQFPEVRPPDHPAPPEPDPSAVDGSAAPGGSSASAALGWLGAALVLVLLGPPLVKGVRRRHDRTTGLPRRRITRAWLDLLATLRFAGYDVGDRPTTGQVLAATDTALGTHGVMLTELVDRALFAVDHLDDGDATAAWRCVDSLRAALFRGLPWWRRVAFVLDPRPLLPRRRRREYATT
ncbi:transglutaminase-like domain-containing protein [Lentzea terrae]|uniref:transglutaminase-like domain-containing protein n=1 Tax=Lentzea terrae TaxID=2200761 RepID=UPI000DD4035C|nr:transglutaminase-like domain-containing protein [Lentzea terrae]